MKRSSRVLVFAKAPIAGSVKTRLIPALGAKGAAQLQRQLIVRTLRVAAAAGLGIPELWCAPDSNDPFFAACAEEFGIRLQDQGEGDLGVRMARALAFALARESQGLLIGCDCAVLTAPYLREADAVLAQGEDAVFGPAEDGGYMLVGLARPPVPELFADMTWGNANVMRETRARFARSGYSWRELEPLWDVDRPEDLARLQRSPAWKELELASLMPGQAGPLQRQNGGKQKKW